MNYPGYNVEVSSTFSEFEFTSNGSNGDVKNLVKYSLVPTKDDSIIFYNLAFGVNIGDIIDDSAIINNGDRDKILATVARTAYVFTDEINEFIIFKGSTPARTRLYQMAISKTLEVLLIDWHIWGMFENQWVEFQKNINYNSFLVKRKQNT